MALLEIDDGQGVLMFEIGEKLPEGVWIDKKGEMAKPTRVYLSPQTSIIFKDRVEAALFGAQSALELKPADDPNDFYVVWEL